MVSGIPQRARAKETIMTKQNTFEKTYTNYTFAPLVTLGIKIAAWLVGSASSNKAGHDSSTGGVVGQAA